MYINAEIDWLYSIFAVSGMFQPCRGGDYIIEKWYQFRSLEVSNSSPHKPIFLQILGKRLVARHARAFIFLPQGTI